MGFDEWLSHDNFFEIDPVLSRNGAPPEKLPGESSAVVVREALAFIQRAAQAKKPFFTVVWFGSPHNPHVASAEDQAPYRAQLEPLRSRLAEITAMDRALGTLRDQLRQSGLAANTLLWYCGDNGTPHEGEVPDMPFRGWKGEVYEGGVRVPGVIEWPARFKRPRRVTVPAVTSDILPTLCAITGRPVPARPLDGINLLPALEGKMKDRPAPICFWDFNRRRERAPLRQPWVGDPQLQEGTTPTATVRDGKLTRAFENWQHPVIEEADYAGPRAVVDGHFKLVTDGARVELYDLAADPRERKNIAAGQPAIVERLQKHLRRWQDSVLKSLTGADYAPAAPQEQAAAMAKAIATR
jgi:arylsulfatase A-like enzyme